MAWLKRGLGFVVVGGATLLFRGNLCHMLFRCGCQFLWSGAGRFCNIHMPNMAHCPWCSHGWWGHDVPTASILLVQAIVLFMPWKFSWPKRVALSVVAFFVVGAAVGLLFGVFSGYPV